MFKRLYDWTLSLAASPRATPALAAISFAESSFFPIPPDVVLVPMALAKPEKAYYYAAVCTIASVLGAIVGYGIGYLLYETVGQWLMNLYGYTDKVDALRAFYAQWGWAFILVKGATPIPFKLVTIVSGLLEYNFLLFVLLCLITRGARFFIVAGLLHRYGDQARALLDRHFGVFMVVIIAFVVLGFWLAIKVL
ncbi:MULTISPECIES: YqaA family protein [unclassified Beijerinckia]|uniref:YqaA family protein n=1 Tax=unclassified Beijerinckia TaxID=2638183 RepID=UPI000896465A|nr:MULTISPECIES: YqaA family protein [unclassified Beijerinckia]MDH7798255.1 membrane protein YqaA with SNARE-associated domain [Beijerinckia sp. GAS462]SED14603.1 membrane protein YqaA, SNARE-associated domain [Beijerinckia sp. 28-YEA-48]